MEFTVPQFIEKEAKIIGPLTFKQFIFVGVAGGICLLLFFFVPFFLFVIIAILLMGGGAALAFLRVERIPLPAFLKNLLIFFFKPKIYLWKKGTSGPRFLSQKEAPEKIEESPEPEINLSNSTTATKSKLKMAKNSRLNELYVRLGGK